jgi:hypothetical protein
LSYRELAFVWSFDARAQRLYFCIDARNCYTASRPEKYVFVVVM